MRFYWVLLLCLALSIATSAQIWVFSDEPLEQSFENFGPRVDNLFIKLGEDEYRLQQDLETGEVDITDYPVPQDMVERWSQPPYNETIAMEKSSTASMYVLDLNNNRTISTYRNWRSPTNYPEFRRAIAHLVNKTRIVTEILEGYGVEMSTPVFPWASVWFNPYADPHPYNPEEAAAILDAVGFVQGSTPNPYYNSSKPGSAQFIRVYPSDHDKAGEDLDTLIFYARYDDPKRLEAAYIIQNELLSLGIPVRIPGPIRIQELENKIWQYHDYHLYTGGWLLGTIPDYLYDLYHSSFYWYGRCPNYNHVNDSELDYWLDRLSSALNHETAKTACIEAQRRLAEIAGVVPLWCPVEVNAYRKVSDRAPGGWSGIVNHKNSGVDCDWTFLNIHQNTSEHGGTVNYGIVSPVEKLNPINPVWRGDSLILSKLYDSLLNENPNTMEMMPWLAESFEIETWFNANTGVNCTKFIFKLRGNVYWHDGVPFTSADVKFTLDYLRQYKTWSTKPWAYYSVSMVGFVGAPDPYTVVIYTEAQTYWPIYYIGGVLIVPKHIWENIPMEDALETMPDLNLVGTGPFRLVEYVPENHVLLEANSEYFAYCPIQACISVNSCRIDPYNALDYNISVRNCFSDKSVDITVRVYFDSLLLQNLTLNLDPHTQVELGPFNIESLEPGLHEIKVEHTPEPYLNRSCITLKQVWSSIIEDINADFKVDLKDVFAAALAYGSFPGHPAWNAVADINGDYKVDLKDYYAICKKFGWAC